MKCLIILVVLMSSCRTIRENTNEIKRIEAMVLIGHQTSPLKEKQHIQMLSERAIDTPDIVEPKINYQKNVDTLERDNKKTSVFNKNSNSEHSSSSDSDSQTKVEKIIEKIYTVILSVGLVLIVWEYLTPSNQ